MPTAGTAERDAPAEPRPLLGALRRDPERRAPLRGALQPAGRGRRLAHHARQRDRWGRREPLRRPAPGPRARARDRAPQQAPHLGRGDVRHR